MEQWPDSGRTASYIQLVLHRVTATAFTQQIPGAKGGLGSTWPDEPPDERGHLARAQPGQPLTPLLSAAIVAKHATQGAILTP